MQQNARVGQSRKSEDADRDATLVFSKPLARDAPIAHGHDREILAAAGLEVRRERLCAFSLTSRWQYLLHEPPYNQRWVVKLDEFLCSLPVWFRGYHPRHVWQKLRPMAVAYVLTKS